MKADIYNTSTVCQKIDIDSCI